MMKRFSIVKLPQVEKKLIQIAQNNDDKKRLFYTEKTNDFFWGNPMYIFRGTSGNYNIYEKYTKRVLKFKRFIK